MQLHVFQIIFHYKSFQSIDYNSLWYTVNFCCLPILCEVFVNPILLIYPSPPMLSPLITIGLLSMSVGLFLSSM